MNRIVALKPSMEYFYGIEIIHDKWIDVPRRQMWIHGMESDPSWMELEEPGVEYMMATRVIKNLHILLRDSKTKPVTIHLHTCGGCCVEGFAIYDTIKAMPYKVTMISYTHARSMSSIILQAADNRILMPSSYYMFHEGTMVVEGTSKQVSSYVEFNNRYHDELMLDIYSKRLTRKGKFKGRPEKYIRKILKSYMDKKEDVYLTSREAIEWGFADKILHRFQN